MATIKSNFSYKSIPTKYVTYTIVIAIALLIFGTPSIQQQASNFLGLTNFQTTQNTSVSGVEVVNIEYVVDGDTATLTDGRKLRYLNIDTPESVKPNTEVQCYAIKASNKNKELVNGKTVYLTRDKDPQDQYDRELVFVFLSQEDTKDLSKSVNAYLIKNGYARGMFYSPNTTYKKEFQAWEAEAKSKNLGLWQECPNLFK